jgi:hypothetical protein
MNTKNLVPKRETFKTNVRGDINGDGRPDFIIGALDAGLNSNKSGHIRIYSGTDPGTPLFTITGIASSAFGTQTAMLGDIDGDIHAR